MIFNDASLSTGMIFTAQERLNDVQLCCSTLAERLTVQTYLEEQRKTELFEDTTAFYETLEVPQKDSPPKTSREPSVHTHKHTHKTKNKHSQAKNSHKQSQ